ncbi:hypothetical protein [Streptomyces roseoverticillatus]|uniref:hypothetical protein n=1 Tax=Streptomyces roseoverticillatus TaxID=66429 RepID=UPI0004C263C2|nr:hypothetical protein [Streptomyces roseoverticillatus]
MTGMTVGVRRETFPGERRAALVPESVGAVQGSGLDVVVGSGAGALCRLPGDLYRSAVPASLCPTDFSTGRTSSWEYAPNAVASQARLTGHKAALLAAGCLDRPLPDTVGPVPSGPARALVLGAGEAAQLAADTLRSLGAAVSISDRCPPEMPAAHEAETGSPADADILITTVRPRSGRPPPVLVTAREPAGMRAGAAVVDTAAGPDGGNVEGRRTCR